MGLSHARGTDLQKEASSPLSGEIIISNQVFHHAHTNEEDYFRLNVASVFRDRTPRRADIYDIYMIWRATQRRGRTLVVCHIFCIFQQQQDMGGREGGESKLGGGTMDTSLLDHHLEFLSCTRETKDQRGGSAVDRWCMKFRSDTKTTLHIKKAVSRGNARTRVQHVLQEQQHQWILLAHKEEDPREGWSRVGGRRAAENNLIYLCLFHISGMKRSNKFPRSLEVDSHDGRHRQERPSSRWT